MAHSSRSERSVSLKALFPKAVFTAGDDILVHSCSRRVKKQRHRDHVHLFVAGVDALVADEELAATAVRQGASAILSERLLPIPVPQCLVGDVRQAYGQLLHALADHPSQRMLTVGVLGTHGKTSAALLIASMLKKISGSVAYWTSLGQSPEGKAAAHTSLIEQATAARLTQWLAKATRTGRPAAVVEISEEMLLQRTTAGMEFDLLVIPSFRKTQRRDGLETRGIETALLRSLEQLKEHGLVVYNADDARVNRIIERHQIPAIGYGLDADAQVRGKRLERNRGSQTMMVSAGHGLMPVTTPLTGDHSLRHVLAAITVGHAFGLELFEVIGGVERLTNIPGRLQSVRCGQDFGVHVDLADQADRLAVALHALAGLGGRILCVAEVPECATPEQRAAYGRVLSRAASRVMITQSRHSTNHGQKLLWEVLDGCDKPAAIDLVPDRAAAIELAIRSAEAGDQILLAGWGTAAWTNNREKQTQTDKHRAESCLYALMNEPVPSQTSAMQLHGFKIQRHED
jgi:UDP-N-acetylmuramoyl-L-alanyl-D-glutamate--2,6-diaminopimelate ligase